MPNNYAATSLKRITDNGPAVVAQRMSSLPVFGSGHSHQLSGSDFSESEDDLPLEHEEFTQLKQIFDSEPGAMWSVGYNGHGGHGMYWVS